jgi:hypothetical protein
MRNMTLVITVAVLLALAGGEAMAQSGMGQGGMGQGQQKRCMNGGQMQMRQQMRDGSCMNGGARKQGNGQGRMRRMGPADGTGAAPGAQDGTGTGSPAVSPAAP